MQCRGTSNKIKTSLFKSVHRQPLLWGAVNLIRGGTRSAEHCSAHPVSPCNPQAAGLQTSTLLPTLHCLFFWLCHAAAFIRLSLLEESETEHVCIHEQVCAASVCTTAHRHGPRDCCPLHRWFLPAACTHWWIFASEQSVNRATYHRKGKQTWSKLFLLRRMDFFGCSSCSCKMSCLASLQQSFVLMRHRFPVCSRTSFTSNL